MRIYISLSSIGQIIAVKIHLIGFITSVVMGNIFIDQDRRCYNLAEREI